MRFSSSKLAKPSLLLLCSAFFAGGALAAPSAAERRIDFDPSSSVLKWEAKKVTGQHHGTIRLRSGNVVFRGDQLVGGDFSIDMTSIVDEDLTDPEYNHKLVHHLSSEDFFDAAKYPTSDLKIRSAKTVHGFTGPTYEVTADLTIKGKTNEVKFPAMIKTKDGKTTATANITLDRTRWGLKYRSGKFFPSIGDKMIYDDFKLDVSLSTK